MMETAHRVNLRRHLLDDILGGIMSRSKVLIFLLLLLVPVQAWATNRSDTCTRSNSTTSMNPPTDGLGNWTVLAGTWGITSNNCYEPGGASNAYIVLQSNIADAEVQVTVSACISCNAGLPIRAADVNNLLRGEWCNSCGTYRLIKVDTGTASVLATSGASALNANDVLKVVVNGTSLTMYRNGTSVVSYTLTGAEQTKYGSNTLHGLMDVNSATLNYNTFSICAIGGCGGAPICRGSLLMMGMGGC